MKIIDCTHTQPTPKAWPRAAEPLPPADVFERERKPAAPEPSGPLTDLLGQLEKKEQDWQAAREILTRIYAARRLTDEKVRAILADLETTVFSIWQEVLARRRKAGDEAMARWSKLMFE